MNRQLLKLLIFLLVSGWCISEVAAQRPGQSRPGNARRDLQERMRPTDNGLRVGDQAPDFKLKALDGQEEFELGSFAGKKPVLLIFGSYT
jgi:hypothetical protein